MERPSAGYGPAGEPGAMARGAIVVPRAPLASPLPRPLGARQERALDTARDRMVDRGRCVRRVHPVDRPSPVDRARARDALPAQPPLGCRRVAHLIHAAFCRHHVLRDRVRPPVTHRSMGVALARRRRGEWPGASRRLASGYDFVRRCPGSRRRARRLLLRAWLAGRRGRSPLPRRSARFFYKQHALRTSSTVFGIPAVKTSGPDSLTNTSSSIRTPMPRHSGSTVSSVGAI
jgi:hypothetical protein